MRHRRLRRLRRRSALSVAIAVLVLGGVVVALASRAGPPASAAFTMSCPGDWGCAQQARFAAASTLLAQYPGRIGIVVRDRTTGAVWRAGTAGHPVWTASTIKLAIAADVLRRARSGAITVDATARKQIADMLAFSSNAAADRLWRRYGGTPMLQRFRSVFGMKGMFFATERVYWGAVKCTTEDLAALMSYVLDRMHRADREYLVRAMRAVDPVQQWGVWAAAPALEPGVKAGWSIEPDAGGEHWVANSVGFAGPGSRYVVAVMYQLPPGVGTRAGSIDAGVHAISDLVATVFGAPVPADVTVPSS